MDDNENTANNTGKETQEILEELERAWEVDFQANEAGKPALEKLNTVDSVYGKLLKRKNQQELLDSGVLSSLKKWLEPLPDKSLPHEDVKKSVFEILLHLTPEVEHLQESGIGKIVLFYSKNPYEKKPIKRLARQLILKWIEIATEEESGVH
ncbi:transcription factor SPN1 [Nematocida minor]|uniref:transcription factor SPN1 n=1 Tax=Nematocida minor TaxID=1912983 RepID=UPI00221FE052|nr:transcription factor SPN1 [Nematocida minor]KAI5190938.1 transcription factor SPN1 [Nematocida minor]